MSLSCGFCLGSPTDTYDSAQFSDAFHALAGDGVAPWGGRLAASVNGFTVTVASGYAVAAGRWVKNDEPMSLTLQPSDNHDDRTDALVVRVDGQARRASIEVAEDVEADKLPGDLRKGNEYCLVLYLFQVRRGATSLTPADVEDMREDLSLCGTISPLSGVTPKALYVYEFTSSGIDREIDRLLGHIQALIDKAGNEISALSAAIEDAGGAPRAGDLQTARRLPGDGWVLCDGGPVPAEYVSLYTLVGWTLPAVPGERYGTYIYGGDAMVYPTFDVDPTTGILTVHAPAGYAGPDFKLDDNGYLVVTTNA